MIMKGKKSIRAIQRWKSKIGTGDRSEELEPITSLKVELQTTE